jgi:AGZA family xanthine/uracil permease-like MFS transporter
MRSGTAEDVSIRTEIVGGITTFLAMAYIIVVNPAILKAAGLPIGASTVATIVVAAAGTFLMGVYARRPIAVAPYMGENAFIAFGLAAMGVTWQQRLASVFIGGILFLLITVIGLRGWLAQAISPSLKFSFAAGIGLFLAFIGLNETGIVVRAEGVPVKIGNLHSPTVLLAIAGFILMMVLMQRRVRGAILISIVAISVAGIAMGFAAMPSAVFAVPFRGEYSLAPIAFHLDIPGVLKLSFLPILLTLFLMSFLDTLGTLVALDPEARDLRRPMTVDAISCILAGLVGTSTSGAFIESAVGIRDGARTGIASITAAALFAMSLFCIPLFEPLQKLSFAYGPALIAVGVLMIDSMRHIAFDDLTELVPAFVTIVMMVFTYNIANGLTAGLLLYPLMKVLAGRGREVHGGAWTLAVLCFIYYAFGLPH